MIIDYFSSEAYDLMLHVMVKDNDYSYSTSEVSYEGEERVRKCKRGYYDDALRTEGHSEPLNGQTRWHAENGNLHYVTINRYVTVKEEKLVTEGEGRKKKEFLREYEKTEVLPGYNILGVPTAGGNFVCKNGKRFTAWTGAPLGGLDEGIEINKATTLPVLKEKPTTLEVIKKLLLTDPRYIQIVEPDDLLKIQKDNPDIDLPKELAKYCITGVASIFDYQSLFNVKFSDEEMKERERFRDECVEDYKTTIKNYEALQNLYNSIGKEFE